MISGIGSVLAGLLVLVSLYFRVKPVSYKIPLRSDQLRDHKSQSLNKYKYPHIGYRPDLMPPHDPKKMWHSRSPFISRDGRTILQEYVSLPKPNNQTGVREAPKALCIVLAGLGDSQDRNALLADVLSKAGFAVHGCDNKGFGRSQKDGGSGCDAVPCLVNSWEDIVDDMLHFVKNVRGRYTPNLPCFVIGQSLGGATALRCTMKAPDLFKGAVLLCPAISSDQNKFLQSIAGVVGFLFPRLALPVGVFEDDIGSRNLVDAERVRDDPYKTNNYLLAATGAAIVRCIRQVHASLDKMTVPFFVIHGLKDMLVNPQGSKLLMEKASVQDKSAWYLEEAWHALLSEPEHKEVCDKIVQWIDQRCPKPPPLPNTAATEGHSALGLAPAGA